MKVTVWDLVTDNLNLLVFFFSTCDSVFGFLLLGLDLVGGVRRDLRVQSYVFYLIVSLRFSVCF